MLRHSVKHLWTAWQTCGGRRSRNRCPDSIEEQAAIATVLSDMDAEIAALEARRDKTR